MDARVAPLAEILELNTRLYRNCLAGLSDEQANARPSDSTNSAAFIAAHLADSRFFLLRALGVECASPLGRHLDGKRGIAELDAPLPLEEVHAAWTAAADALRERLSTLSATDLDAAATARFPVSDRTVLGVLTFLVQHDSYHVGQLAMLRKFGGLPAMKYS